jgi:hypothetical protein
MVDMSLGMMIEKDVILKVWPDALPLAEEHVPLSAGLSKRD